MLEAALILLALSSMSSLGLELTSEQLDSTKKMFTTGIVVCFLNLFLLPLFAFLLCKVFQLSPSISLGIFLCTCSGGGASAGLFILKAKGSAGTGAAMLSLLNFTSLFTAPLLITLYSGSSFFEFEKALRILPKLLAIGLAFFGLPLGIGFWIRKKKESVAFQISPYLVRTSNLSLGFSIFYLAFQYSEQILEFGLPIWITIVLVTGLSFTIGIFLFKGKSEDRRSIGVVSGIRNLSLALLLANEQTGDPRVLITILLYGFIMYLVAFPASFFWRRWKNIPV
ncbi:bile acid:sodium symporter family protein [Leptospira stimsonii]|uniref:Na+-dependent transporter n=1 Tax=Leptospira stimsonii TaxID=2202203 RepID=A0A8B3CNH1_9LEPT|nr:Na+-dependent transporter [Leptospira stimsonii]RHX85324.1 Na+-dependent transporter [Leptospira stimsonii]